MNNGINQDNDIKGKKHNLNFEDSTISNKKLKLDNNIKENDNKYVKNQTLNSIHNEINEYRSKEIININSNRNIINNSIDKNDIINISENFHKIQDIKSDKPCDKFFKIIKLTIYKQYTSKNTVMTNISSALESKITAINNSFFKKNNNRPSFFIPLKENFNFIYDFCHSQIKRNRRNALGLKKLINIYEQFKEEIIELPQNLDIINLCLKYGYSQYLNYISMFNSLNILYDLYLHDKRITEDLVVKILTDNNFYKPSFKVIGINDIMREIKIHYIKALKEKYKFNENLIKDILNLNFLNDFVNMFHTPSDEYFIVIDVDNNFKNNTNNNSIKDSNNNINKINNNTNKDRNFDVINSKGKFNNEDTNNNQYYKEKIELNKIELNNKFKENIIYLPDDSNRSNISKKVNIDNKYDDNHGEEEIITLNNEINKKEILNKIIEKTLENNETNKKEISNKIIEKTSENNEVINKEIENKMNEKISKNNENNIDKTLNENLNNSISSISNNYVEIFSVDINIDTNNDEIKIKSNTNENIENDSDENGNMYNESYSENEESYNNIEFDDSESPDSSESISLSQKHNLKNNTKILNGTGSNNEEEIKIKVDDKRNSILSSKESIGHYNLRSNSNLPSMKINEKSLNTSIKNNTFSMSLRSRQKKIIKNQQNNNNNNNKVLSMVLRSSKSVNRKNNSLSSQINEKFDRNGRKSRSNSPENSNKFKRKYITRSVSSVEKKKQKQITGSSLLSNSDLEDEKNETRRPRSRSNSIMDYSSKKVTHRKLSQSISPFNSDQSKKNKKDNIKHLRSPANIVKKENQEPRYMTRSQTPQKNKEENHQHRYNTRLQASPNSKEENIQKSRYRKHSSTPENLNIKQEEQKHSRYRTHLNTLISSDLNEESKHRYNIRSNSNEELTHRYNTRSNSNEESTRRYNTRSNSNEKSTHRYNTRSNLNEESAHRYNTRSNNSLNLNLIEKKSIHHYRTPSNSNLNQNVNVNEKKKYKSNASYSKSTSNNKDQYTEDSNIDNNETNSSDNDINENNIDERNKLVKLGQKNIFDYFSNEPKKDEEINPRRNDIIFNSKQLDTIVDLIENIDNYRLTLSSKNNYVKPINNDINMNNNKTIENKDKNKNKLFENNINEYNKISKINNSVKENDSDNKNIMLNNKINGNENYNLIDNKEDNNNSHNIKNHKNYNNGNNGFDNKNKDNEKSISIKNNRNLRSSSKEDNSENSNIEELSKYVNKKNKGLRNSNRELETDNEDSDLSSSSSSSLSSLSSIKNNRVLRSYHKKTRITYYGNGSNTVKYIPSSIENYNNITKYINNKENAKDDQTENINSNDTNINKNNNKYKNSNINKTCQDGESSENDENSDSDTEISNSDKETSTEELKKNKKVVDNMKNYMENTRTLLSERSDVMEDLILIEENCAQALRFLKPLINDLLKYQEKIDRNYKLKNRLMNHINRNFN